MSTARSEPRCLICLESCSIHCKFIVNSFSVLLKLTQRLYYIILLLYYFIFCFFYSFLCSIISYYCLFYMLHSIFNVRGFKRALESEAGATRRAGPHERAHCG